MKITTLPKGYTSSRVEEVEFDDLDEVIDYLSVVHIVQGKDTAPCILPCTLRENSRNSRKTKTGRPRVSQALEAHLLIFDIDDGDVDAGDLEGALDVLGVQALTWPTWKAGSTFGMRWRVVVPLSKAVTGRQYKSLWISTAKAIERALAAQGCPRPPHGWVDWSGKTVTQPAVLPCVPSDARAKDYGGLRPSVTWLDDGGLLDPGNPPVCDLPRPGRGDRDFTYRTTKPKPYVPRLSAHGEDAYRAMGERDVPGLVASLDASEVARRDGIPTRRGARHASLSGVCFALYRAGADVDEIAVLIGEVVEATSAGSRAAKAIQHTAERLDIYWSMRASVEDAVVPSMVDGTKAEVEVPDLHLDALTRYCRILARYRTLRRPKGGQVDHGAVARIVGLPVQVVVAWRGALERAGVIRVEGSGQGTRYALAYAEAELPNDNNVVELLPAAAK